MKDTILVTGASGFLGRSLLRLLNEEHYHVIPLVRSTKKLPNEVVLDLSDDNFVNKIQEIPQVNAIIHLGTKVGFDGASRQELFVPNVLATAELANWANKIDAYFVFASAAIVCGVKNPHITSESKPNPDIDYAYSKWLAEELIKMSGVEYLILRISGIYGRNGPQHLGINNAIGGALQGKPPTQFGKGDIKRNYIYVGDLSRIIIDCLKRKVTGVHTVAGPEPISISEMLKTICEVFLPGTSPVYKDGGKSFDQIVDHSKELLPSRNFREVLEHIRMDVENENASCSGAW